VLSRRFWVSSTESLRFLGDLTPLLFGIFKPKLGLSPKVFSRILQDFFVLH
jgi:hypothetical protein